MTRWQRRTRACIAVFGVVFAVFVAREFQRRDAFRPAAPVSKDPGAIIETIGADLGRFSSSREDVRVKSEKQLTYADGSSKLLGVTIVTDERHGNRTFTITGKEGRVAKNDTTIALDGEVRLVGSDGMQLATEHATYADSDAIVRALIADGPAHGYDVTEERGSRKVTRPPKTDLCRAEIHVIADFDYSEV